MHTFRKIIANLLHTNSSVLDINFNSILLLFDAIRVDDGVDTAAEGASDADVDGDEIDCNVDNAADDVNAAADDNEVPDGEIVAKTVTVAVTESPNCSSEPEPESEPESEPECESEVGPECESDVSSERRCRCRRERRRRQLG